MDVREKYVIQKVNRKEKSICPNCIHHNLCIAENNQPCFECNRFIDANGVTVQEWFSVDDKLPDKPMKCLVYTKRGECGGYEITYYNQGFNLQYSNVTHWMPLPLEPEVKND